MIVAAAGVPSSLGMVRAVPKLASPAGWPIVGGPRAPFAASGVRLASTYDLAKGQQKPFHLFLRPQGDAQVIGHGPELAADQDLSPGELRDHRRDGPADMDHREIRLRRDRREPGRLHLI